MAGAPSTLAVLRLKRGKSALGRASRSEDTMPKVGRRQDAAQRRQLRWIEYSVIALRLMALTVVGFMLAMVTSAPAAIIEAWDIPGDVKFVHIKGEIRSGDAEQFEAITVGRNKVTVVLESPGGLVNEALRIGASIRLENFATMVLPESKCYSACGLIWVSGARRYMSESSEIGFHAAYREEAGEFRESGMANAEIGSFLTHLGLRIEAIRFFTVAGPRDFVLLTPARARALGIDIFENSGFDIVSPDDAPTVDILADRFISYGLIQSRCLGFLQPEIEVIEGGARTAAEEGMSIVANEKWIDLWLSMMENVKSALETEGALSVCLQNEKYLRARGQPTGIDGPSFDCTLATTKTENAICADADLWAKDRSMNSIYIYIRRYMDAQVRKTVLASQREWMKIRNACGSDILCLNNRYDDRLQFFSGIDVGSLGVQ